MTASHRRRYEDGSGVGCALLAGFAVVVGVACAVSFLPGCGASALRIHAQTATVAHSTVENAGTAIEAACALEASACHDAACIDGVEARCTAAASARDALILPVSAYRDAVLLEAANPDETGPAEHVIGLGATVLEQWPAFAAALRGLGIPVPSIGGTP